MSKIVSSRCLGVRELILMAESAKTESLVQIEGGRIEESVGSGDCWDRDMLVAFWKVEGELNGRDRCIATVHAQWHDQKAALNPGYPTNAMSACAVAGRLRP